VVTKVESRFSGDGVALRGLRTEGRVLDFLPTLFPSSKVRRATEEENKVGGIDVWIDNVPFDIKDQKRAERTGRVCFEYATQGVGQRGFTPARQWAKDRADLIIVVGNTLYFVKRSELKAWFINNGCMFDAMATLGDTRRAAQKNIGHQTTDVILGLVNLENLPWYRRETLF
jgi:hypothetical protein